MQRADEERLRDMLDAASEAAALLGGRSVDALRGERALSLALAKLIEIVGEAASSVSAPRRATIPGIPWPDVIATRNRLIHGYYSVDVQIVADTIRNDFPPMIRELTRSLSGKS